MDTPAVFAGIDVSKAALDVALRPTGERFSAANDDAGIRCVLERLLRYQAEEAVPPSGPFAR